MACRGSPKRKCATDVGYMRSCDKITYTCRLVGLFDVAFAQARGGFPPHVHVQGSLRMVF